MATVQFTGWSEGLRKVSLTELLHQHAHIPLRDAKSSVERLMDGESFTIECATFEEAQTLANEAIQLGAVCVAMP